jgi:hypothetical protein
MKQSHTLHKSTGRYYFLLTLLLIQFNYFHAQVWSNITTGTNNDVYALTTHGANLFVGGDFSIAGGNSSNFIAKWDNSVWSPLGTGVNLTVNSLAGYSGDLYVGGQFSTAGGTVTANNIARWNGSVWSQVGGNGANNIVNALRTIGNDLYAGGGFTTISGTVAARIARWDGTSWYPLGTGMNNQVTDIVSYNSEVFACGSFTLAGGNSANYIAKWNGTSWMALGTGLNAAAFCMAVYNGELYVGGNFTTAGSNSAMRIAKWNGTSWTNVGLGLDGTAYAMAVYGGKLYVGGAFTTAGGGSANYIASWDGTTWANLGVGTNDFVNDLTVYGSDLIAGGYFTTAGGNSANRVAKWNTCNVPAQPSAITGATSMCFGSSNGYSVAPVVGATSYTWSLPVGWSGVSSTNSITASAGTTGIIDVVASNTCGASFPQSISVTVNPLPTLTLSTTNTLLCAGQIATLTVSGANTYSWSTASTSSVIYVAPVVTTSYSVNGIDANGCTNTQTISQAVSPCTGIVSSVLDSEVFNVFPNPFHGTLKIRINESFFSNEEFPLFSVYNALGSLIHSYQLSESSTDINTSQFSAGLYYYKLTKNRNTLATGKIMAD